MHRCYKALHVKFDCNYALVPLSTAQVLHSHRQTPWNDTLQPLGDEPGLMLSCYRNSTPRVHLLDLLVQEGMTA